jgi:hypothetical protein
MLETVGFTKKPVQLMVKTSVARKAKAPARRSLCFVDDIVISDRRSRPALILPKRRCSQRSLLAIFRSGYALRENCRFVPLKNTVSAAWQL